MRWTRAIAAAVAAILIAFALTHLGAVACSTGPTTLDVGFLSDRSSTFDASLE